MSISSCLISVFSYSQALVATGVSLFLLCSCALPSSYTNHYFPVKNRAERASTLGFSIAPPPGVNWYEKLNDKSLYYLKKIQTSNYAIYTKATEIHLDNSELESERFLQYVKNDKKLTPTGDYRNISIRFAQDKKLSPLCVRYFQNYEDHGNKTLKKNEFVRIYKNGLVCMHPESPGNGVDMFYVESYMDSSRGELNQSYKDEGEFFLSSLKFHPVGG
jgi:hypothetical protein